jgi:hypothetical protein
MFRWNTRSLKSLKYSLPSVPGVLQLTEVPPMLLYTKHYKRATAFLSHSNCARISTTWCICKMCILSLDSATAGWRPYCDRISKIQELQILGAPEISQCHPFTRQQKHKSLPVTRDEVLLSTTLCRQSATRWYMRKHANSLFDMSFVLTAKKAMVRFHSSMNCHTKHYSLMSQKGSIFLPHKLFFRTHIYWHGSTVKTVIWQAIAHTWSHQWITSISAYFDYMEVADNINSQKWENCNNTQIAINAASKNQVPSMQLQIFYFHTGKI